MSPNDDSNATSPRSNTVQVELNLDYESAHRFPGWLSLSAFSAICLAALQSQNVDFDADQSGKAWVLSVCIISMVLSFVAVLLYLCCRGAFVGQIPEVAIVSLLIGFWAAGLPTIMNPDNRIAVVPPKENNIPPVIINANLYFFSWLAFGSTVFLSGSMVQEMIGIDVRATASAHPKASRWYGLMATSLVVMGAAVRTFQASECKELGDNAFCRRTKLAVSIGVIGFFLSILMTFLATRNMLGLSVETSVTCLQLIFWVFAVSYITFGTSPGSTIGNLYFSTWISFILTVVLFANNFREYVAGREAMVAAQQQPSSSSDPNHPPNGREETYDDAI